MGAFLLASGALLVPAAWAAASDLSLEPGARGAALFSAAALAPGHPVSRCVAVTASNPDGAPADARLYGSVSGALATGLLFRVELGTGGSYDSCSGFTGTSAFSGTLADFGALHNDFASGLRQTTATATYRFTVEVSDDQQWQGLSASTQFVWEAQLEDAAAAPTPSPSPSPSPSVSPSPAPAPTGGPTSPAVPGTPGPGPDPGPGRDVGPGTGAAPGLPAEQLPPAAGDGLSGAAPPSPSDSRAGSAPVDAALDTGAPAPLAEVPITWGRTPATAPSTVLERPRELAGAPAQGVLARAADRIVEALQTTARIAGQVAVTGARAAGMPVGLLALVVLFLATQDRIDRSDPRLRLSPLHAPHMLEFSPADPA
jgi:hypothetical protein